MKQPHGAKVQLGRLFRIVLPALAILLVGALAITGFIVYKVCRPAPVSESANPSHYLLSYLEVPVSTFSGIDLPAWWIPGLKGAPGIILAPGYGMDRSDALSLAAALHDAGFNLLIYNQRGNGSNPRATSSLGLREPADMLNAVDTLRKRPESDPSRIGIWGVDIGAHSALRAMAKREEIRAVVADGAYETTPDFLNCRIGEDFGLDNRIAQWGVLQVFRVSHLFGGGASEEPFPFNSLGDRSILFIKGENRERLGNLTAALYDRIQPQKEMISIRTARRRVMVGEDLKSYDRQVANFFRLNLH